MNNKIELKEIKKNQTGSGLLIENDGYISMYEFENKNILESTKNGSWNVPDPFIVDAIFQKFDIENANNRIYPERILKQQVDVYIKKYMQQNCSTGEADHPECICNKDSMVLTDKGWVSLWDKNIGETNVLTYNNETDNIEFNKILNHYIKDYKGEIINFKNDEIDVDVTPNHKFPIYTGQGVFVGFYTAEDILNSIIPNQDKCYISNKIKWNGIPVQYFELTKPNSFPKFFSKKKIKQYSESVLICTETWVKIIALFLSCGYVNSLRNLSNTYLSIKNDNLINNIKNILETLPFKYTLVKKRGKKTEIIINDLRLSSYLRSINKTIPSFIKNLNKEMLFNFYIWFKLGLNKKNDIIIDDEKLANDVFEIITKLGYSPSINSLKNGFMIKNHTVENIFLNKDLSVEKKYYDGKVACIEVNNHNFIVKTNGKIFWSGNSSSISTKTISHMITELHWEGNTLVGKMKIITSEGFRKFGIISCMGDMIANLLLSGVKIGVSSRGIGSVENKMGKYYVSDDFELVCWDIVTQPSTPGSWIGFNKQEIQQYVESKKSSDDIMAEKIKKLDKYIM